MPETRDSTSRAELPAPVVVRNFLSDEEIRKIFAFGREMQVDDGGALVNYGEGGHFALFLHHGGFMFDDCWPPMRKLQVPNLTQQTG